jgi:putative ABC transport system permease protein
MRPLLAEMTDAVRPALVVLLAGAALVLLIACANVANLLLSRGVARRRELAVRAAVGAGRARLVRQLLTETTVLSVLGGIGGVTFASALTRAIPVLAPEDFPRLADIRVDGVALSFAALASLVTGLLAGALPALRTAGGSMLGALREGAGASGSAHTRRLGAGLLVAEAAVAVMLLVAAGLLGRSFVRLLQVDPGYDAANVLMARVYLPPQQGTSDREERFAELLVGRARALPGVTAAGASNMAPFIGMSAVVLVTLRGDSAEPITAHALSYVITPGYGGALGMRVRQGRLFEPRDMSAGIRPIILNEEFARVHFRDGRPVVGRRFTASFAGNPQVEIVGIVANVLKDGLDTQPQPEMYHLPRDAFGLPASMNVAIRTTGDPLAIVPAVRQAVRDVDATAAVDDVETLGSRLSASVSEPRFAMAVLVVFAFVALLLAAIGLYGVLSYQVSQRRRELGIRGALGASRASLVALVLRQGLTVTLVGIVLGLAGAAWTTRLLQGLLFGITPHDVLTFGVAPVALLIVAIVATAVPARRAASVDPIEALRCE